MTGRVIMVTGAGRGLGREVARQAVALGAHVIVAARDGDTAVRVAGELANMGTGRATSVQLDLEDATTITAAAHEIFQQSGRLDVLVNNAAAYVDWSETASGADLAAARAVMEVNLYGTWALTQALLPLLRASAHPRIVNVASGAGSHADRDFGLAARGGAAASYGISKAALLALTSTLAAELHHSAVLVNAVCPGLTATWAGAEAMGGRPLEDGARSIMYGVTLPDDGPSGGFFRDGRPLGW